MTDRHGHYLGYQVDGCRCEDCTTAHRVRSKQRDLYRIRHGGGWYVDAAPAIAVAAALARVWGCTASAVVRAAVGCSAQQATNMVGRNERLVRHDAEAIRHVTPDDLPAKSLVNAGPARFMRDTLQERHGWTLERLAEVVGVSRSAVELRCDQCLAGTWQALRRRVRDEALRGVCERCDELGWAGGRWCQSHAADALSQHRAAKDAAYRETKRRQALEQHRGAA